MKNLSLLLLATVGVLVGCSKNEAPVTPEIPATPSAPREIRIASAIEATGETKAAMGANSALNSVRFLRVDQATTTPPTNFTTATALTANRSTGGTVAFTPSTPIYKLNDYHAFFAAYWPAAAGSLTETANTSAVWSVDGKTDILLSDVYNAGKYSAPITGAGASETAMALRHQLAQLEVICKADPASTTAESVVQAAWGTITKIELLNTAKTVTYTYADQKVAFTAPTAIPLLQAGYTTTFPGGVAITKNASSAITAAGMFAPVSGGSLKLKVYTSKVTSGKEVTVQLKDGTTNKDFENGKKHTATLIFKADDKNITVSGTTIDAWGNGYSGSGDLNN